ncbi:MAG TPA: hypothetical protein VHH73_14575 [Verrucomicrobiae bacterium]|nr:hypothetical protein [Verrucomicrobiae bacterium]
MTGEDYALFRRCLFLILPPQLILVVWRGQLRGLVTDFRTLDRQIFATALAGIMLMQVQGGICYEFFGSLASARSLYLIDLVISFCLLLGVKMALDFAIRHFSPPKPVTVDKSWRVAIVGTGSFAVALARDLTRNARSNRKVVAFFDDNPLNWHRQPLDVPVLGMPECLLKPEWQEKVDEIIVALPDEDSSRSEQVVEMLRATPFKVTVASSVRAPDIRQTLVSAL